MTVEEFPPPTVLLRLERDFIRQDSLVEKWDLTNSDKVLQKIGVANRE
jgi:hypothetical protein